MDHFRDAKANNQFGVILKSLRLQNKLTMRKLEALSGISNAYLSQLENGKRKRPSPTILKKLSPHLNRPYAEMMDLAGYGVHEGEVAPDTKVFIPILHNVMPSSPLLDENHFMGYKVFVDTLRDTHFLFHVPDDSMRGYRIHKGDHVLVTIQNTAEDGDIVVVTIDNEIATLRMVKKYDDDTTWLISTQTDHKPTTLIEDVTILGRATEVMFNL